MKLGTMAAVLVAATLTARAQTAAPTLAGTQPDPLAAKRQIEEEMTKLQDAPGVKEVFDLQKKISALDNQVNQEKEPLIQQMEKFEETAAYKDYENKYNALAAQRSDEWEIQRKKMAEAAKELYAARHTEIAQLAPGDLPSARALGFDVLTYPRLDGSTSTHPLAVILASRILNVPYAWTYPEPSGSPWGERAPLATDRFPGGAGDGGWRGESMEFTIASSRAQAAGTDQRSHRIAAMINSLLAANTDTHTAYVNLIDGTCDINLTARGPSADEAKLAAEREVELELVPIATDALVFLVHQSNPVRNLTLDQIRNIYVLKTQNWNELGAANKAIRPFLREPNSGSRELFDALVMKTPTDQAYARATGELYAGSMAGPYNRVTQEPEGIGYSVYYYEHFMALSPYTRNLAINGVEPNADTLASGKYPLSAPVYAALRKSDPPNSPGRKLVAYLTSAEGKKVIGESGYVPIK